MPIYTYKCEKCEHEFDALMRFEDPAPICPKCQAQTKRQLAAGNFVLKGDGWTPKYSRKN